MKRTINYNLHPKLSISNLILVIQVSVFLIALSTIGMYNLYFLGAKYNAAIRIGEYWRLVTPMFIHAGFEHLVMNSLLLYFLGNEMEILLGKGRFILLYFGSGIAGYIASFAFTPVVSVGSSTALFGLLGAIIYYYWKYRYMYRFQQLGMQYSLLIIMNVIMGFFNSSIDQFGHLGGLVGGFLIAGVVTFKGDRLSRKKDRLLYLLGYFIFIFVFFALGMIP